MTGCPPHRSAALKPLARPNLYLEVAIKSSNRLADFLPHLRVENPGAPVKVHACAQRDSAYSAAQRYAFEGPTIVYTQTRRLVEELHAFLRGLGIKAGMYHAGRPEAERYSVHHDFVRDQLQVRLRRATCPADPCYSVSSPRSRSAWVCSGAMPLLRSRTAVAGINKPFARPSNAQLTLAQRHPHGHPLWGPEGHGELLSRIRPRRKGRVCVLRLRIASHLRRLPSTCHVYYAPADFMTTRSALPPYLARRSCAHVASSSTASRMQCTGSIAGARSHR